MTTQKVQTTLFICFLKFMPPLSLTLPYKLSKKAEFEEFCFVLLRVSGQSIV
jgi:hypothetical protein